MRGALTQQGVAGRADQYCQSASGDESPAGRLNINAKPAGGDGRCSPEAGGGVPVVTWVLWYRKSAHYAPF
jgi:hypothetical protein